MVCTLVQERMSHKLSQCKEDITRIRAHMRWRSFSKTGVSKVKISSQDKWALLNWTLWWWWWWHWYAKFRMAMPRSSSIACFSCEVRFTSNSGSDNSGVFQCQLSGWLDNKGYGRERTSNEWSRVPKYGLSTALFFLIGKISPIGEIKMLKYDNGVFFWGFHSP